jgi:tetratricopeptide (TPR) repeat protein/MinD-like ATPase involved in chromosome partitioning or flagellar assembly
MFVTFYSYKGGVGRTLALANAAYLLATDKYEPCKVLLWDFDLEAPGIPHLFRCRWGAKKQGFVDLVDTYLGEAKVPPVQEYIHQSEVPGIDLLPAGYIDGKYSGKLERINWRLVYEKAHGYDFLESIGESIRKIEPQYDYVLIDSRTGYSDVGGICLHQLPDLVVLMFRLNSQNLDGTQKVFSAIQRYRTKTKKHVDVIPVVSPAWPFATTEANSLVRRAKKIFGGEGLLDISFDSSLTFGEKLIVREGDDYEIKPRVLHDYVGLARAIRSLNLQDITTIFRLGTQKQRDGRFDEAYDYFCRLVRKRRDNQRYWLSWTNSVISSTASKDLREGARRFLDAFIEEDPLAAYAFLARARLCKDSADQGIADVNRAIQADSNCAQAYWDRALISYGSGKYGDALLDFEKYLGISQASAARVQIGVCLTHLGRFEAAAEQFEMALKGNPRDPDLYRHLARVNLARGQFEAAHSHCLTSLALSPNLRRTEIVLAHAVVGLGRRQEAESLVREILAKSAADYSTVLECAEVYLALEEPSPAVGLLSLSKPSMTARESKIRDLLRNLALLLKEAEELVEPRLVPNQAVGADFAELNWSLLELRAHFSFPGPLSHLSATNRERLLSYLDRPSPTLSPAKI